MKIAKPQEVSIWPSPPLHVSMFARSDPGASRDHQSGFSVSIASIGPKPVYRKHETNHELAKSLLIPRISAMVIFRDAPLCKG